MKHASCLTYVAVFIIALLCLFLLTMGFDDFRCHVAHDANSCGIVLTQSSNWR